MEQLEVGASCAMPTGSTMWFEPTKPINFVVCGVSLPPSLSLFRVGMRGRELMGGVGKTMMQSGGTFGTFMSIGMGIRC